MNTTTVTTTTHHVNPIVLNPTVSTIILVLFIIFIIVAMLTSTDSISSVSVGPYTRTTTTMRIPTNTRIAHNIQHNGGVIIEY